MARLAGGQRSRCRFLGVVCMLCAAGGAGARADETDDYIAAQMARQHIPGLSLAVLKDGKPVKMGGYGMSNLELQVRATPETVYAIGSVSKQFLAAGIVLLTREGAVGLDDSVRKYLVDAPETWQPITVRHLLTHTSGLLRETPGFQLKAQRDMEAIRAGYAVPLLFKPGEKWQYSNLGYSVLAEIITRASNMPWPRYLQERIFAPLGMGATRTTTAEEVIPHRASGYHWMDSNRYQNAPIMPGVRPSGAFLSTTLDLAKWDEALSSDQLFSAQERALMWTPVKLNDGSEKPYGLGWEVASINGHRQVKHAGTMLGFRSQIVRLVEDRLTIIILTNATQALPEKIAAGVAVLYLPDLKARQPQRQVATLPADVLDGYTGRFALTAERVITVSRRGGKLSISTAWEGLGEEAAALLRGVSMEIALLTPEDKNHFFDEDDPRSTYVFVTDAQGKMGLEVQNTEGKVMQKGSKVDAQK